MFSFKMLQGDTRNFNVGSKYVQSQKYLYFGKTKHTYYSGVTPHIFDNMCTFLLDIERWWEPKYVCAKLKKAKQLE